MDVIGWFFFDLLVLGYVEDPDSGLSFRIPGGLHWAIYIEVEICRSNVAPCCCSMLLLLGMLLLHVVAVECCCCWEYFLGGWYNVRAAIILCTYLDFIMLYVHIGMCIHVHVFMHVDTCAYMHICRYCTCA